jgi:hypothetical protein
MCWALYLASDRELPEVPWDEAAPAFNTQPLTESEVPVKKQFSLPFVTYLGSHHGCGCGFIPSDFDEPDEKENRKKTVQALLLYLGEILKNGLQLEMFLCWEGDQLEIPVKRKTMSVNEFMSSEFPLAELEFANIVL